MTLKQLASCAAALKETAKERERTRKWYRGQLERIKDRYDDLRDMTEDDKKTACSHEERIVELADEETALIFLAQKIEAMDISVKFDVIRAELLS